MTKIQLLILLFIFPMSHAVCQEPDAILSRLETTCAINSEGLQVSENYEVKINNREGERFTKINIPYTSRDKILKIKGSIKDKNGNEVRVLKKSEIVVKNDISGNTLYEDSFVSEFTLKHNEYPYFITYSTEIIYQNYIYIANWVPVIDLDVPTTTAEIHIIIPKNQQINVFQQFTDTYSIDSVDNFYHCKWTCSYKGDLSPEIHSPPVLSFLPNVRVMPREFYYDIPGNAESWETFGNWLYRLNEGAYDLPGSEKTKIASLIRDFTGEREKLEVLYRYLQDNTRYINIAITTGRLKPFPASYVAKNNFGDCKALTVYFKSILDFAGFKSYYTLIRAGDPITKINNSIPGPQFNHAILFIPLGNEQVWVDCTSNLCLNYTSTFIQNREAFIVRYEDSYFLKTPSLTEDDVTETRKVYISRDVSGSAHVHAENKYRGYKYELLANISQSLNNEGKRQIINKHFIPADFRDVEFFQDQKDLSVPEIQLVYNAHADHFYNQYGEDIFLELFPLSIPAFEETAKRKLPVQVDYPVNCIDTVDYAIPAGYVLSGNVKDVVIESEFGSYSLEFIQKESTIRTIRRFRLGAGEYYTDKYSQLKAFLTEIEGLENSKYIELN